MVFGFINRTGSGDGILPNLILAYFRLMITRTAPRQSKRAGDLPPALPVKMRGNPGRIPY